MCGLSLPYVGSRPCSEGFSPGTPVFLPPQKPTFPNSNIIVQFQKKNPYPPLGKSSEIPSGRGILKVKILEAKYEAKLKFPGDGGAKQKNLLWRDWEDGYFLELHI